MFFGKINSSLLETRIDAGFYHPKYTVAAAKVSKHNTRKLFQVTNFVRKGIFDMPANLYCDEGIPFLRISDFDGLSVDTVSCIKIPKWKHEEEYKTKLFGGDLVISKVGTTGEIAKVPANNEVNISQNLVGLSVNHDVIDSDYLLVVLKNDFTSLSIERHVTTAVQGKLTLDILRDLDILFISLSAQKYIGGKVRQAEQLKAWAEEVQAQVRKVIPRYLNQVPSYEHKYFKSERSELSQLRLDASFYHPDYINLDNKLRTVGCSRLGTKCTQVKADWNKKAEFFSYFEIGGLNVADGTIEPTVVNVEDAPSRAKTGIQLGDVLVSTVRPNRKNVAFVSEDFSPLPMVATSGFSVLRFDSLESAAFYHAWLRTDDATHQLMRWNSGSAYPAIDDDVPLNILVPEFDEAFVSKWGSKVLLAHYALIASRKLVQVAKLVVEMLIDGQLTEQQLIDAQKALDADDDSLDRDILGRLTTKGLDGEGDPLFADLDQLYGLLAQCQPTDE